MMLKMLLMVVLLLLRSTPARSEAFHTKDPLKAFVRGEYAWGDDYFIHGAKDTILFRCILNAKRDGVDGVALSEVSIWGNHGGPWEVFTKTANGFVYVGSRNLPDPACLESCQSKQYLASGRCRWQHGWPSTKGGGARASTGADRSAKSIIGTLDAADYSSAPFECDCEFYRGHVDGNTVVFATRSHRTRGFAKIDGRTLSPHRVTKAADPACRRGGQFSERWSDSSVSIGLEAVVTSSGAESCWYHGRMIVTVGGRRETIPVTGSCGC